MSLWDNERVERYIRLYGDPREKKGSQSLLCSDISKLVIDGSVADFGCGMGHLAAYMEDRSYLGIDSSEGMLEKAREFFPEKAAGAWDEHPREFMQADVTDMAKLGLLFDNTVAVSLALHLERHDALSLYKTMWEHTKLRGMMIFSMETKGESENRRSDGLLIRNQLPENVVKDIIDAIGARDVRFAHQKITMQTINEFYYQRDLTKITNYSPIARTTIFWIVKG